MTNSKASRTFLFCFIWLVIINAGESSNVKVVLKRCVDFNDQRDVNDTSNDIFITIPDNFTNVDETVDFGIDSKEYKLPCKDSFVRIVSWEKGTYLNLNFKSKNKVERLRNSGKTSTHFNHDGYFYDKSHYYKPDDYCIKSISENEIQLRICNISCEKGSNRICVPKCCGPDEILIYWNFTCRKIADVVGETKWMPSFYDVSKSNHPSRVKDVEDKIHYYRKHLHCELFDNWPLSDALRAKKKEFEKRDKKTEWIMLADNSRPLYYTSCRNWDHIPEGEYCIDGFANWGFGSPYGDGHGNYTGIENHTVLLLCPKPGNLPTFAPGKAWTYFAILLLSSSFLLLTALIHLLLIDKQHLHGLTVLCHSVSMYFFYVFLAIAHLVSIFPNIKGDEPRGTFCMIVAIMSHYFFMTTFVWLTVMNFDLWLTFRSMRPVSKISKRIRRFWFYFCVGWGLPALISAAFYTVDEVYRDPKTRVIVPDYADKSCFVAICARGKYMYSLVAIALSVNTVLVVWTFYIFYEFRKQNANTFTTKRAKSDKYSVRLFTKLFCVMGVAWFVELISWKYNGEDKPWPFVILDCLMFMQAFAIFFIFCINRRTLAQLEEKYPFLRGVIGPIRTYSWFKASHYSNGMEMTTPGSTPRKSSVSTTKIDSTLPRKASSSSALSVAAVNKYFGQTGKMENVNLDSDSEIGLDSQKESVTHTPDLIANT